MSETPPRERAPWGQQPISRRVDTVLYGVIGTLGVVRVGSDSRFLLEGSVPDSTMILLLDVTAVAALLVASVLSHRGWAYSVTSAIAGAGIATALTSGFLMTGDRTYAHLALLMLLIAVGAPLALRALLRQRERKGRG